jgi:urate oxidase
MVTRHIGEAERMTAQSQLEDNRYGKSRIRLVRVKRQGEAHEFREWAIDVLLRGDFADCFVEGDNRRILPTDTMKNTVYSLARDSRSGTMEDFAQELVEFLLRRNAQVSSAEVTVSEKQWDRLSREGRPHPTAFVQLSRERQITTVSLNQDGEMKVVSGLEDLVIMKTADSGFEGYIKDELTTLPESSDRLFGTSIWSRWKYRDAGADFAPLRAKIRETLLAVFAEHKSKSVQHTLYAMADRILQTIPQVEEIELRMPNLHCLPVDLSRFGQDNPNEIFVPIDEPHGYIEARIRRKG